MKASALVTLLFLIASSWLAEPTHAGNCRDHVLYRNKDLSAAQLVKQDLLSGVWTYIDSEGKLNTLQFLDYGIAEILISDKGQKTVYVDLMWRVEEFDGAGFLILTNKDMKDFSLLKVSQNCEGMIWTNVTSREVTALKYEPPANLGHLNKVKSNLFGEWSSITNPLDDTKLTGSTTPDFDEGAYLNYSFEADDTFTCQYGNNTSNNVESGTWKLSPDGKFLILFTNKLNGKKVQDVRTARLKQADGHFLFFEHETLSRDLLKFKGLPVKDMGFIK